MRPIVKAVGLICILAHDYLIVKIKMLFGYPVAVIDHKHMYLIEVKGMVVRIVAISQH